MSLTWAGVTTQPTDTKLSRLARKQTPQRAKYQCVHIITAEDKRCFNIALSLLSLHCIILEFYFEMLRRCSAFTFLPGFVFLPDQI